jgi:4-diphosphocytidyl-2-C-methyl-D-erythritol kinase
VITCIAPAKLTLSLRVTGVRDDGYHLIDAEMVSLDLGDCLEIEPTDGPSVVEMMGPHAGAMSGITDGSDLVSAALRAAKRNAHVRVHKAIPAGAGLGGGSSDAAAILRWAQVSDVDLAVSLGADVGFCLRGGRARVTGIGEQIEPLGYERRTFTLLTPPLHCSTPTVYRRWDEMGGPIDPLENGNDLTEAAISAYPELAQWRDKLEQYSHCRPQLAGSGSTWFVPGHHHGDGVVWVTTTTMDVG